MSAVGPAPDGGAAVEVSDLHKHYGRTHALRGLDLTVQAGTVCAVLGPNGAGKTTAVRVLSTLTAPDTGRVRVAGFDVVDQPEQVRRNIGLAGQHAAVDEGLTGRENLWMFARLHHLGDRAARRRADELLARFDLLAAADKLVGTYSGGMRRRLDLLASLIVAPPVLFLDEPTVGLDPRSRQQMWGHVVDLVSAGTTVLLTTQYLEEADHLADHVVVVDHGRAIASGTPDALKASIGTRVEVVVSRRDALAGAAAVLAALTGAEPVIDSDERTVRVTTSADGFTLPLVVRELDAAGVVIEDVALRRPTLDEVFLRLTDREPAPAVA
ncbi:ATP-binding cassette domain-containing protein [Micromonospora echinofusca]|uniref:ATP-binding cassette domain-containing protein n=1 Tax=Micromonospora echinofusca TaxID=47858 RepID=A0ABS3VKF3_MICEH|nr:ATP-binding cassette domain-containing protein [Micromonospora echinofusca]MBO4205007.1 ATP-binding cassette domain-containing protein [Micromonospora echinofusca]